MQTPSKGNTGFALVSAIWVSGLVAVITSTFAVNVHSHLTTLAAINRSRQSDALAESIVLETAKRISNMEDTSIKTLAAGSQHSCRVSTSRLLTLQIQDQAGLVDINSASPQLLEKLLSAFDYSESEADRLTQDIVDFRDVDQDSRYKIDENTAYAVPQFQPKNRPYDVVEELDQVPSVSDKLLVQTQGLMTTYSQQTGVDLSTAPLSLLSLLNCNDLSSCQMYASPSPLKVFSITASITLTSGLTTSREAIINVLRQPDRPFAVLSWRKTIGNRTNTPPTTQLPQCFN